MAETLDKAALKALSADTRQEIVKMLLKRPYTASEISRILGKHVTTVSEHLGVLESSGLVRKKDSTNKWVYYTLTDKGEKLFKPAYYSWVVVFSVSFVLVITGFLRMLPAGGFSDGRAEMLAAKASDVAASLPAAVPVDATSISLIFVGILGFAYLTYRAWERKKFRNGMKIYAEYAAL